MEQKIINIKDNVQSQFSDVEQWNKRSIKQRAFDFTQTSIDSGTILLAAAAIAAIDEFAKQVRKEPSFIDAARDELIKHNGKYETPNGTKLEICEAGTTYDYSHYEEWRLLDDEIKLLTERKKQLEEKLRKIAPGRTAVDTETGELLQGALKSSTSTYRATLKK